MANEMMETTELTQKEFNKLVFDFLELFKLVFDDDWMMTKECLADPTYFISGDGTFLDPQVADESNNWQNRGALLERYRELRAAFPSGMPPPEDD